MGTNYYLEILPRPACTCCGREYPIVQRHIGLSSAGWCFQLHVIPEDGINSLDDWKKVWSDPAFVIKDEYDRAFTKYQMMDIITQRSGTTTSGFDYQRNHAVRGPNGLVRSRIDGERCIGHGEGTWDLIAGDFC